MKKFKLSILALSCVAIFYSCNKSTEIDTPIPNSSIKQSDQTGTAEIDDAMDAVSNFISNEIGGGSSQSGNMKVAAYNLPCGSVSIDTSQKNSAGYKIYKINYGKETRCGYKYLSGNISFQLKNKPTFSEAGAIYDIKFDNYVVLVKLTGSSVTLNGTITVTNVDGGYVWQAVTNNATIKHKIRGKLKITYANGDNRDRNLYQLRTWSSTNGWAGLSLTVAGDTTINSNVISEIGKTYEHNYDYQTELDSSFVWKNCGSTFTGPYTLNRGYAVMNVIGAPIQPATITVHAGYEWDITNASSSPKLVKNCSANAYKVTSTLSTTSITNYQLY